MWVDETVVIQTHVCIITWVNPFFKSKWLKGFVWWNNHRVHLQLWIYGKRFWDKHSINLRWCIMCKDRNTLGLIRNVLEEVEAYGGMVETWLLTETRLRLFMDDGCQVITCTSLKNCWSVWKLFFWTVRRYSEMAKSTTLLGLTLRGV